MLEEDDDLYLPLLTKFRTPLISAESDRLERDTLVDAGREGSCTLHNIPHRALRNRVIKGKKKTKWDKYKEMYHMLSNFKGCCAVLISVRGLIAQTTITNKVTADYINFYFWGMVVKARADLRDMDQEDDLICMRLSTAYYECTVTVGGVFEESDFMILVTQNTPHSVRRPIYNLNNLVVQGTVPCDFPVQTEDPVPAMRKAIIEMTERTQDSGFSPYEKRKIAFLSAAERGAGTSIAVAEKASTMSLSTDPSKRGMRATQSFAARDEVSFSTKTSRSKMSQASSCSVSVLSYTSGEGTKSGTKHSTAGDSKSESRQASTQKEKKYQLLRKEKYDWIKIDKDDPMVAPETAPLYERTTSEESSDAEDDDIGYWRRLPEKTFSIFGTDGTVVQDEVSIGFKPCSGEQFPPRKWINKKAKKEMVFKRKQSPPPEQVTDKKKEE